MTQTVRNLPSMQEIWKEDSLENELVTHSSNLVWRVMDREAWQAIAHGVTKSQT